MIKRIWAFMFLLGASVVFVASPAVASPDASAGSREAPPPGARDFLEERVELEGALQVLVEDRRDGSRQLFFLETDSGQRYAIFFASRPTRLVSGARVKVTGSRIDRSIVVESGERDVQRVSGAVRENVQATATLPNTFGAQRTAVILVNFSDKTSEPYTPATASSIVFDTTSSFDLENSYGQTWLTGDVFGWYTIALTSTVCDYDTLASQAESSATAAGVNLGNYSHYVFAFPSNACTWWGLGTVGGNPSQAWINGSFQLQVVAHEMGHNFGLYHSHSLDCGSVVLGTNCTMSEYGDTLDTMGYSSYHFNSYQKERLGWLNSGASPALTTVSASGAYWIEPYETLGSAPKALKIPQGTTGAYFYVELRRGLGFDASLGNNSNISNGVVVHLASSSDPNTSDLLDMNPPTSFSDPALTVGQAFTDPTSGVSITVNSVDSTGSSVTVGLNEPPPPPPVCTHLAPAVSMSPSQTPGVAAGTAVNFSVSVTNQDGNACTASVFAMTFSVASGWTASLTSSSLSISPGASASTTLTVTSPTSAGNGSYPASATATNQADATARASASVTYVVNNAGSTGGTFADSFNRSDSTALGGPWIEIAGNLVISSNMLKNALGATGSSSAVVSTLSGTIESAEADFTSVDNNSSPRFGVVLRYQSPGNYYLIYRQAGGSSRLVISRFANGVETILASASVPNPPKKGSFHLKGRVNGTTLSLDLNGTNKVNAADATFSTGKVGVLIGNNSTSAQQQADNFSASVQ